MPKLRRTPPASCGEIRGAEPPFETLVPTKHGRDAMGPLGTRRHLRLRHCTRRPRPLALAEIILSALTKCFRRPWGRPRSYGAAAAPESSVPRVFRTPSLAPLIG